MARITVEDCLHKIPNRFELVLLASKRARDLSMGATALLEEEKDKPTVIALREIAEGFVNADFEEAPPPVVEETDESVSLDAALAAEFSAMLEEGDKPKAAAQSSKDEEE